MMLAVFVVLVACFVLFGHTSHEIPSEQQGAGHSESYDTRIPEPEESGWAVKHVEPSHSREFINPKVHLDTSQVQDRRTR